MVKDHDKHEHVAFHPRKKALSFLKSNFALHRRQEHYPVAFGYQLRLNLEGSFGSSLVPFEE